MRRFLPLLFLFALPAIVPAQEKPAPAPVHAKGYKPLPPARKKALHDAARAQHGDLMAILAKRVTPPAEFDCKDMGWSVPPGDQGSCGSCYLYSTVKTMNSAAIKAGLGKADLFRLATQYGMDSPRDFGGCNGGNGTEVIAWAAKNGWVAEADPNQLSSALYPAYEASSGRDRTPAGAKKFTPKTWQFVTGDQGDHPATVEEFKAALMTFGIVNIAIDAGGQFGSYSGGVITSMGSSIDHEVNIRGWSDEKQALLCENQWAGWGNAKSKGDNCCWISYKAVGDLQDPFTVLFESVIPPAVVPVITSATTANAVVGAPFSFQITATGNPTIYSTLGNPAGLLFNKDTGLISGTPAVAGVFPVALTASNAAGDGKGTLTITVTGGPLPPPPPPPPGSVTIGLTPEQVASVNAQSGATVITGGMTLQEITDIVNGKNGVIIIDKTMTLQQFLEAVEKSKRGDKPCPCPPKPAMPAQSKEPPPDHANDLAKLTKELAEQRRALAAIMEALSKKKE